MFFPALTTHCIASSDAGNALYGSSVDNSEDWWRKIGSSQILQTLLGLFVF